MARRDPFESLAAGKTGSLPFPFVLDELASLDPVTRPMFGSLGVYVGDRIVMILRDKGSRDTDSGVWLAYQPEHEASLLSVLPRLTTIDIFRSRVAGWRKLSSSSVEFEDDVGLVCQLLREGDERIGKVPNQKRPSAARTKTPRAAKKAASKKAASKKTPAKKAPAKKAASKKAAPGKTAAKKAPAKKTAAKKAPAKKTAAKKAPAKKTAAKKRATAPKSRRG